MFFIPITLYIACSNGVKMWKFLVLIAHLMFLIIALSPLFEFNKVHQNYFTVYKN